MGSGGEGERGRELGKVFVDLSSYDLCSFAIFVSTSASFFCFSFKFDITPSNSC